MPGMNHGEWIEAKVHLSVLAPGFHYSGKFGGGVLLFVPAQNLENTQFLHKGTRGWHYINFSATSLAQVKELLATELEWYPTYVKAIARVPDLGLSLKLEHAPPEHLGYAAQSDL